jgi:hypothetical protein
MKRKREFARDSTFVKTSADKSREQTRIIHINNFYVKLYQFFSCNDLTSFL